MAKVLGKITEDELSKLQKTKENTLRYREDQERVQEIMETRLENINLKISIENMIKDSIIKEIRNRYPDKDFSKIVISESGEIIDPDAQEEN